MNEAEALRFVERLAEDLKQAPGNLQFTAEPKYDGLSCSIVS